VLTLQYKVLQSSTQAIKFLCEQNPLRTVLFSLCHTAVRLIPISIFVVFRDDANGVSYAFEMLQ
jgi:hypothetical protein